MSSFFRCAPRRFLALWMLAAAVVVFYALNLAQVVSTAQHASPHSAPTVPLLLLGKRTTGHIDADFLARLLRTQALLDEAPSRALIISGGRPGVGRSEALVAQAFLFAGAHKRQWVLEQTSRTTAQNLVFTDRLLANATPLAVVSNRYHLARIQFLARAIGRPVQLVAAEDQLQWSWPTTVALLREAVYLSWARVESLFLGPPGLRTSAMST